jgi:hypothetical protein
MLGTSIGVSAAKHFHDIPVLVFLSSISIGRANRHRTAFEKSGLCDGVKSL